MTVKINISVGKVSTEAELLDTPTATRIIDALPIEGSVNVWGDEIYFEVPLSLEQEPDASADVAVGDLAYWPAGHFAFSSGPLRSAQGTSRGHTALSTFLDIFLAMPDSSKGYQTVRQLTLLKLNS